MSDLILRSGVGVYHRAALRADPLAASRRTACESVCCVHPSRRLLRKLLIRNLGLSGGDWLNVHGEAHVFEAPDQALGLCDLGAAVEMIGTEILIYSSVFEHVVRCRENGGGDGAGPLLWPAFPLQAQILGLQIAPLFVLGRPASLDERGLEPLRAFAQSARSACPSTLVVVPPQAGPTH